MQPLQAHAREPLLSGLYKMMTGQKDPDPMVTRRAPFIKPNSMATPTADSMGLPYNYYDEKDTVDSLAVPHRDKDEVAKWLTGVISEILDVDGPQYENHLKNLLMVMSPDAISSYDDFMQSNDILTALTQKGKRAYAFVEEEPLLVNKGIIDNRYQWLYILPATLTLMSSTQHDYESLRDNPSNYRLQLRIQIARTEEKEAELQSGLDPEDSSIPKEKTLSNDNNFMEESKQGLIIKNLEIRKNPYSR